MNKINVLYENAQFTNLVCDSENNENYEVLRHCIHVM